MLFPSPGDLPNPGIEPSTPALQADSLPSEPPGKPTLDIEMLNFNSILFIRTVLKRTVLEKPPKTGQMECLILPSSQDLHDLIQLDLHP